MPSPYLAHVGEQNRIIVCFAFTLREEEGHSLVGQENKSGGTTLEGSNPYAKALLANIPDEELSQLTRSAASVEGSKHKVPQSRCAMRQKPSTLTTIQEDRSRLMKNAHSLQAAPGPLGADMAVVPGMSESHPQDRHKRVESPLSLAELVWRQGLDANPVLMLHEPELRRCL